MSENTNQINDDQLAEAKKEIEAVLQKYNILLVPIVIHHGDRTISRIDITPAIKQDQSEATQPAS